MVSFSKLGNYGRLGNQLFQYAFLRTTARRLGTQFYCPRWEGDQIFDLDDKAERATEPRDICKLFDAAPEAGFTSAALAIEDHTEIEGFFQSEKYYTDKAMVRQWYTFRNVVKSAVHELYPPQSLKNTVTISLRLDDDYRLTRDFFPLFPIKYYLKCLNYTKPEGPVLVFADRIELAKTFLNGMPYELKFVDNLTAPQQLFLLSQCRVNVITNSTFTWWGSWLNTRPDRMTIGPTAWCREGVPRPIRDILCDDWVKVRATRRVCDHFLIWKIRHPTKLARRLWQRATARFNNTR